MGTPSLEPVLHNPVRRRLCSALVLTGALDRATLQRLVALPDATLDEHLAALEGAGYVAVSDVVRLTDTGRSALVTDEAERDRLARQLRETGRDQSPPPQA
ncbi:winged helix-turn-helix domain-containing protein [Luteipulveratus halotolerans]|uniref:ArsR family transcriptional regulator n=1 Tax=Luteipulveratus halotolerans TaxID=1631356 RepID=A0A0L6CKZ7_9MICO|nr:helix-turn-helix domain-containing protein [Luteipulveratus halotolerans]KNX38203.1 hypothetical protein VV01_15320 [Luteipulveratus halotolerans]